MESQNTASNSKVASAAQKQNISSVLESMRDLLRRIEDVFPLVMPLITGCSIDFIGFNDVWRESLVIITRYSISVKTITGLIPSSVGGRDIRSKSATSSCGANFYNQVLLNIYFSCSSE
jgi:hypothetical protein